MTVTFPAWYVGSWPDREELVMDLLQPFLDLMTPTGYACTWLNDNAAAALKAGRTVVRVYRGGLASSGRIDQAAVQLGVISETRKDSWAVLAYCREVLLAYEYGGTVGGIAIRSITEMTGPQQLPEFNPDDRLVAATFNVECDRPRNIPEYARVLEQLGLFAN